MRAFDSLFAELHGVFERFRSELDHEARRIAAELEAEVEADGPIEPNTTRTVKSTTTTTEHGVVTRVVTVSVSRVRITGR